MSKEIRELVTNPLLDDQQIVKIWMGSQSTTKLFDMFNEILRDRIQTFEIYARMVKNNCQFNLGLFDGDEKHLKLAEIRNKFIAGENIDEDWKYFTSEVSPEELKHNHIDGADYIEKVNDLLERS